VRRREVCISFNSAKEQQLLPNKNCWIETKKVAAQLLPYRRVVEVAAVANIKAYISIY